MAKVDKPSDLIPSRRPLTGLTADRIAQVVFDQLVAQWSLTNAHKIVQMLAKKLKGEAKRRRGK